MSHLPNHYINNHCINSISKISDGGVVITTSFDKYYYICQLLYKQHFKCVKLVPVGPNTFFVLMYNRRSKCLKTV